MVMKQTSTYSSYGLAVSINEYIKNQFTLMAIPYINM